ncbi:hypothetical protein DFH27DRAFT_294156 [Peziza echinospora]|nr:hypothetical protein DFH27DRAFT_294156 [Peziza echinospora]
MPRAIAECLLQTFYVTTSPPSPPSPTQTSRLTRMHASWCHRTASVTRRWARGGTRLGERACAPTPRGQSLRMRKLHLPMANSRARQNAYCQALAFPGLSPRIPRRPLPPVFGFFPNSPTDSGETQCAQAGAFWSRQVGHREHAICVSRVPRSPHRQLWALCVTTAGFGRLLLLNVRILDIMYRTYNGILLQVTHRVGCFLKPMNPITSRDELHPSGGGFHSSVS